MSEENMEINSDVSTDSSSEVQETSPETTGSTESNESAESKPQSDANVPFHEHPRFKELVEQKNRYAEQAKALEQRYAEMERRFQTIEKEKTSAQKQEDALIARLKGIDPEFGSRFEKLDATQKELEALREWRSNMEQRQFFTDAANVVNNMHAKNNLPVELQTRYNRELDLAYRSGAIKSLDDVSRVYSLVHDEYTKFLDGIKRAERESYVSGKKADSKTPTSQPKGKAVSASKEGGFSKDPAEARAQLVSRVLKLSKADKDI